MEVGNFDNTELATAVSAFMTEAIKISRTMDDESPRCRMLFIENVLNQINAMQQSLGVMSLLYVQAQDHGYSQANRRIEDGGYHKGEFPRLRPSEVPVILRTGRTVDLHVEAVKGADDTGTHLDPPFQSNAYYANLGVTPQPRQPGRWLHRDCTGLSFASAEDARQMGVTVQENSSENDLKPD